MATSCAEVLLAGAQAIQNESSNELSRMLIVVRCRGLKVALSPSWTGVPRTGYQAHRCAAWARDTPASLFYLPLGPLLQEINSSGVMVKFATAE